MTSACLSEAGLHWWEYEDCQGCDDLKKDTPDCLGCPFPNRAVSTDTPIGPLDPPHGTPIGPTAGPTGPTAGPTAPHDAAVVKESPPMAPYEAPVADGMIERERSYRLEYLSGISQVVIGRDLLQALRLTGASEIKDTITSVTLVSEVNLRFHKEE